MHDRVGQALEQALGREIKAALERGLGIVQAAAVSITGNSRSPVRAIRGTIMPLIIASSSSPNWIFSGRLGDTD